MPAYVAPTRLDDALATLGSGPYVIVAGATDHYPARVGRAWTEDILDVSRVVDLGAFGRVDDGWWIPATTTWTEVRAAELPPLFDGLREAAATIGGVQIQNRGTVVGNVANASPAADGIPSLMALDAEVELASVRGRRRVPVGAFVTGNRATLRASDELVTGIHVPDVDGDGRGGFEKLGARTSLVISIAMVAGVLVRGDDGRVADARIAVGACSPVARRLPGLEARLRGQPWSAEVATQPVTADLGPLSPIDDLRGTADYRLDAALTLVRRLLVRLVA
jgi:CO/xanthine dehydrogenase FAD-binding subunit